MSNRKGLTKSYTLAQSLDKFYTGGPICVHSDLGIVGCCSDETEASVVHLKLGKVVSKISNQGSSETESRICALAFDSKGNLAVSRENRMVSIYDHINYNEFNDDVDDDDVDDDVEELKRIIQWKAHVNIIMALDFDGEGKYLATGSADHTAKVWNTSHGFCTHNFTKHHGRVTLIKFFRRFLFTCDDSYVVRVWGLDSKDCICKLINHQGNITKLFFNEENSVLYSSGRDRIVSIWNIEPFLNNSHENINRKTKIVNGTFPAREILEGIVLLKSNVTSTSYVITGGEFGKLKLYKASLSSFDFESLFELDIGSPIIYLDKITTSDLSFVVVTGEQEIFVYRICEGSKKKGVSFYLEKLMIGYHDQVLDLKYNDSDNDTDDETLLVVTNSNNFRVLNLKTYNYDTFSGHSDIVMCVESHKEFVVSGSKDNDLRLWNITNQNCLCVGNGHADSIGCVVWGCKKSESNFFSGSKDRTIKKWMINFDKKKNTNIKKKEKNADADADSNLYSLKALKTIVAHSKDINRLAISPNGQLLASCSQDKTIKLWDTDTLDLVSTLAGHKRPVWSVSFSPVDRIICSCSGDSTIRLWSVTDYSCLKTFEGHSNSVLRAEFLTFGMQLISVGADGLLKLWTVKDNECIGTWEAHDDKIWALDTSKDGMTVITGSADSTIKFWKDNTIEVEEKLRTEEEQTILTAQKLENSLQKSDYNAALILAFQSERPQAILKVMHSISKDINLDLNSEENPVYGYLTNFVKKLQLDDLRKLFGYIRDWNTTAKNSAFSQVFLHVILTNFDILNSFRNDNELKQILIGILSYTNRHYSRISKLIENSYIIDYTLERMNVYGSKQEDHIDMDNMDTT